MSAPVVSGTLALLFERDPTLTQDKLVALLQAGAHRLPDAAFDEFGGPGEVDAAGALDALAVFTETSGEARLPSREASWITPSASFVAADGSTPLVAIVELRTAGGERRAGLFDEARLRAVARIGDTPIEPTPPLVRKGPGLYYFTVNVPKGRGGARLTVSATFDGVDIVAPRAVSIATDALTAELPASARGGCAVTGAPRASAASVYTASLVALALLRRARHRRRARGHSAAIVTR